MFPSLAARKTYVAETNFLLGNKKKFLPQVENIFATRTQTLYMCPILATMKSDFINKKQCFRNNVS